MKNQHLKALLEGMEREKTRMLNELKAWSAADLTKSEGEKWNALQVLEHVIGSEIGTLGYLKKKTLAPAHELAIAGETDTQTGIKLSEALRSTKQWKAPEILPVPRGAENLEIYAVKWQGLRGEYAVFVDNLSPDYLNRLVFRHPIAGMLDLEQTLTFLRDHITHHMHQLERIKASLK